MIICDFILKKADKFTYFVQFLSLRIRSLFHFTLWIYLITLLCQFTFTPDTVMASGNGMMYIEMGTDETPGAKGFQIALMLSRKYTYLISYILSLVAR